MPTAPPASAGPRLSPGDAAPPFTLTDDRGETVSLAGLGRPAVLFFYPAAGTPGCTREAGDFRDHLAEFASAGYLVLGISPDPVRKLRRFREQQGLSFPLLSDPDRTVIAAYGAWGPKTMYGKTTTGLIRSTIVVDAAGMVTGAYYNVKATGHVARLQRELLG